MLQTNAEATESLRPYTFEFSKLESERLPPQDYLEATKPTDIIPQPKKKGNNYTHTLKTSKVFPKKPTTKSNNTFPTTKHPKK